MLINCGKMSKEVSENFEESNSVVGSPAESKSKNENENKKEVEAKKPSKRSRSTSFPKRSTISQTGQMSRTELRKLRTAECNFQTELIKTQIASRQLGVGDDSVNSSNGTEPLLNGRERSFSENNLDFDFDLVGAKKERKQK